MSLKEAKRTTISLKETKLGLPKDQTSLNEAIRDQKRP